MTLIQDIAGENSPVAPFAKSAIHDKYAILTHRYDDKGRLYSIVYEDYVTYKGKKIDFIQRLYLQNGSCSLAQYIYGKEGNLWKINWSYDKSTHSPHEQKIGRKFQKFNDVYEHGYLKERQFVGEKSKQSFCYSMDYFKQGCICLEWVNEKKDFVVRVIERYDDAHRLISRQAYEAKLSDPTNCQTNQMLSFHYYPDTKVITQIDRFSNDSYGMCLEKTLLSDFDKKGNWLKASSYRYEKLGDEEKCVQSESREIAYDEATAQELKAKFDSLLEERNAEGEYVDSSINLS